MTLSPLATLPLFYRSVVPLSSSFHPSHGIAADVPLGFARATHIVPLTVDEFSRAQCTFPIVFGSGSGASPLALLSLADGTNSFVTEAGTWQTGAYVPAFVRRFPFLLAKINEEAQELSLCFDDTAGLVGPDGEQKFFENGQPTAVTRRALDFCAQFEQAVERTRGFMAELDRLDLLIDGEFTIQHADADPVVYRGFRIVAEDRLKTISPENLAPLVANGTMGLVYAHLFSLAQVAAIHGRLARPAKSSDSISDHPVAAM